MGSCSYSVSSFASYAESTGKSVDYSTGRTYGQAYTKVYTLDSDLDPKKLKNGIRECRNSEEHPNTIPVVLALDVTGSMGKACDEVRDSISMLVGDLYNRFEDVEIMIMGIGDVKYDEAPIQISQFESDVRIAESVDKLYLERGGGGNYFESYTAAWYMGVKHMDLDCWTQGRKGIIITMGDEQCNPYLPQKYLNEVTGDYNQSDVETPELYKQAKEKFHLYHLSIKDKETNYAYHKSAIDNSWSFLGQNYIKDVTIDNLKDTIVDCISSAIHS